MGQWDKILEMKTLGYEARPLWTRLGAKSRCKWCGKKLRWQKTETGWKPLNYKSGKPHIRFCKKGQRALEAKRLKKDCFVVAGSAKAEEPKQRKVIRIRNGQRTTLGGKHAGPASERVC